ncbi:MAG: hypothetical protein ACHQT9_03170 [Candidatus Saccharimonadales bacterium]
MFALLMGIGQAWLAIPTFFTLDPSTIRFTYHVGEFFIYSSMVAQAAVVWCLFLRSHIKLSEVVLPITAVGLISWAYAIPNATLQISNNFINYRDPTFSTVVIGLVFLSLFIPVGVYFLRSATKETRPKTVLTALGLGLVYVGVGFFTGGVELITGQVITPISAVGDLVFFFTILMVLLWPRRHISMAQVDIRT